MKSSNYQTYQNITDNIISITLIIVVFFLQFLSFQ